MISGVFLLVVCVRVFGEFSFQNIESLKSTAKKHQQYQNHSGLLQSFKVFIVFLAFGNALQLKTKNPYDLFMYFCVDLRN